MGNSMDIWPTDLSPEGLADWLNQRFNGTLMGHLGMRALAVDKERAVIELPVHSGLTTPSGHIHAGSMVSLADTAATFAAMAASGSAIELSQMPVAVSISSQIVANIQDGTLLAESTVAHPGRTLVAVTTRITDVGGKLLALVNSTHFVLPSN